MSRLNVLTELSSRIYGYLLTLFQQLESFDQGKHLLLLVRLDCQTGGDVLRLLDPQLVFNVSLRESGTQGPQGLLVISL